MKDARQVFPIVIFKLNNLSYTISFEICFNVNFSELIIIGIRVANRDGSINLSSIFLGVTKYIHVFSDGSLLYFPVPLPYTTLYVSPAVGSRNKALKFPPDFSFRDDGGTRGISGISM